MDDFSEKLQSIISNPETLGKIGDIAKSIMQDEKTPTKSEEESISEALKKIRANPKINDLINLYETNKKERMQLLLAIKPFLTDENKEKLDSVISFFRLLEVLDSAGKLI